MLIISSGCLGTQYHAVDGDSGNMGNMGMETCEDLGEYLERILEQMKIHEGVVGRVDTGIHNFERTYKDR